MSGKVLLAPLTLLLLLLAVIEIGNSLSIPGGRPSPFLEWVKEFQLATKNLKETGFTLDKQIESFQSSQNDAQSEFKRNYSYLKDELSKLKRLLQSGQYGEPVSPTLQWDIKHSVIYIFQYTDKIERNLQKSQDSQNLK